MNSVVHSISQLGGLAATNELYRRGHTRAEITGLANRGRILRVRQGWYTNLGMPPALVQAARVGGRLTCLSGAAAHGIWQYPTHLLHVALSPNTCRPRHPQHKTARLGDAAVRLHWRDDEAAGNRFLLDPVPCLADVIRCQPSEVAIATADSALNQHLIDPTEWLTLLAEAPAERRRNLGNAQPLCESGIESLVHFRLRPFRLPIRCQAQIPGVGRVDFLVGTRLVVETDGAEYHTDPRQFENDRRRDAHLSRLGYRVLRFSYRQVMYHWAEVEAAILAAVIRGDHN